MGKLNMVITDRVAWLHAANKLSTKLEDNEMNNSNEVLMQQRDNGATYLSPSTEFHPGVRPNQFVSLLFQRLTDKWSDHFTLLTTLWAILLWLWKENIRQIKHSLSNPTDMKHQFTQAKHNCHAWQKILYHTKGRWHIDVFGAQQGVR